ncbi:hypothetical protein SERLA73DRAFT_178969 [Serpula lacrymans var. lacrymans S7.3]|uniref:PQ loop repeat protein n=2 Tax=Serpula lacrymans var. lacrymans TaxID=341189 RepID=F8PTD9_SERL3|nr:uncharacterized protein SERLADRAFT_463798 [Serpula lacrymans var. lacrymans S7.9]EGO00969.1 hypothetical protein SERLA73DRAFT_178969 [Serpula lacrymans var. lacrymans S7.3]EGO26602.1 hypothetical protein SERLADRAFT_463798 [Serpula lacrymans var. lacrymans S7.9]
MADLCHPDRDWISSALSAFLIYGLVISYIPQHLRIYNKKSSEGFSPWYLLLGSTSSAAGMLNMIALQWPVIRCCKELSAGQCVEITAGVSQVILQWLLFTVILVLYMIYYPPHLKYVELNIDAHDARPPHHVKTRILSNDWRLSIILSWVVFVHLVLLSFVTILLLATNKADPTGLVHSRQITLWATFLGVSSAILAAIQYMPQLLRTFQLKLVGALSIPMMVMQSPGGIMMAVSIARRPGTNWTSWAMFAVSAIMQLGLLIMCIAWKFRQRRLGVDDFGHDLMGDSEDYNPETDDTVYATVVENNFRDHERIVDEQDENFQAQEGTPLLRKRPQRGERRKRLLRWFLKE